MSKISEELDLDSLLEMVVDRKTFVEFIKALSDDFALERSLEAKHRSEPYGPGTLGWENGSIDQFLESAAAWGLTLRCDIPVQKLMLGNNAPR